MSQFLNPKMILVLAISALMLAGCGRKNTLAPIGPSAAPVDATVEAEEPKAVEEDKPFILDRLL